MHIIFEGPDGAGKSTIINAVVARLQGKTTLVVQQPGTTPAGIAMRAILKGSIKMDPMTRQALHLADTIEFCRQLPSLKSQYDYVIQDRTSFISSPIYGKAERGECTYHIDWYKYANTPKADKLIFILSKRAEEQTRQRGSGDHFDNMSSSFHKRVYDEYVRYATDSNCAAYTDLIVDHQNLLVIHNDGTVDEAVDHILTAIS